MQLLNGIATFHQANGWVLPPLPTGVYGVILQNGSPIVITSTGLHTNSNFSRTLEVQLNKIGGLAPYDVSITQWKETTE